MRNAARILTFAAAAVALSACGKPSQPTDNQELSVDENVSAGGIPANAEIETLPPDESSVTSNGELVTGEDNPDLNSNGNAN